MQTFEAKMATEAKPDLSNQNLMSRKKKSLIIPEENKEASERATNPEEF